MPSDTLQFEKFSLNIKGRLREFERPQVMAILNVTPDSFYAKSRVTDGSMFRSAIETMIEEGADIIDIGGCSTRPGAQPCSAEEEWTRIEPALRTAAETVPEHVLISVDTFRSEVARRAVVDYGAHIVNDVSGGDADEEMFSTVAMLRVPYVATHSGGIYQSDAMTNVRPEEDPSAEETLADIIRDLSIRQTLLNDLGVTDVIVDPGIGFGKTQEADFAILKTLPVLSRTLKAPILIGLSRKSLITRTLECSADDARIGTAALNTVALLGGASIVRVHDVADARRTISLLSRL